MNWSVVGRSFSLSIFSFNPKRVVSKYSLNDYNRAKVMTLPDFVLHVLKVNIGVFFHNLLLLALYVFIKLNETASRLMSNGYISSLLNAFGWERCA